MGENKRRPAGRGALAARAGGVTALAPAVLTLGLLLLVLLANPDVSQHGAVWLMGLTAAFLVVQALRGKLRPLAGVPALAVVVFMVVFGVSTFYAAAGKFAMKEYTKLLTAFAGYLWLLLYLGSDEGERVRKLRNVLFAVAAVAGIIGLVSVDGTLGGAFAQLVSPITRGFVGAGGVELNTRITSILGNPNNFAGFVGIGVFAALALVSVSKTPGWRRVGLLLLELNSMSFLLAFSMGASAAIACGFVLLLVATRKENRGAMALVMIETFLITFLLSFVTFPVLTGEGSLPLVFVAVACALLLAVDALLTTRLTALFEGKGRLVTVVFGALIALAVVFVLLAYNLTGTATLRAGEGLRRAAYPEAGAYTLTLEGQGDVNVTIESQDERETIIHSSTVLYSGSANGATFTVPEGSLVVYFNFAAQTDATIEKAVWSGTGGEGKLPLDYLLLPGFISNRLQGLWANQNAIQRTAFFRDGMKLFAKQPLLGSGIGAFENGVKSVQDFYYETSYVHNHYIQSLADAGILGLGAFLLLLGAMALTLLRGRKREGESALLVPALMGCLLFMAVHAGVEVVFSSGHYLILAFAAFALMSAFAEPLAAKGRKRTPWPAFVSCALLVVFCGGFAGLWALSDMGAKRAAQGASNEYFFVYLEQAAALDRYNRNDYLASYVVNAAAVGQEELLERADGYAQELSQARSNIIGQYLVDYYLKREAPARAFEIALESVEYVKSDVRVWDNLFAALSKGTTQEAYLAQPEVYEEGVRALYARFQEVSEQQLDHPQLNAVSHAYIDRVEELAAARGQQQAVQDILNTRFTLSKAPDSDGDGLPDALHVSEGTVSVVDGALHLGAGATVAINFDGGGFGLFELRLSTDAADGLTVSNLWGSEAEGKEKNGLLAYQIFVESKADQTFFLHAEGDMTLTELVIVSG